MMCNSIYLFNIAILYEGNYVLNMLFNIYKQLKKIDKMYIDKLVIS